MEYAQADQIYNVLKKIEHECATTAAQSRLLVEELHALNLAVAELTKETQKVSKSPALGIFGLGGR